MGVAFNQTQVYTDFSILDRTDVQTHNIWYDWHKSLTWTEKLSVVILIKVTLHMELETKKNS